VQNAAEQSREARTDDSFHPYFTRHSSFMASTRSMRVRQSRSRLSARMAPGRGEFAPSGAVPSNRADRLRGVPISTASYLTRNPGDLRLTSSATGFRSPTSHNQCRNASSHRDEPCFLPIITSYRARQSARSSICSRATTTEMTSIANVAKKTPSARAALSRAYACSTEHLQIAVAT